MVDNRDLLVEIGTEELPPKSLKMLSEAFSSAICAGLEQHQLDYASATPIATPRRLAVLVRAVAVVQADRAIEKRGPAVKAAYDAEGQPSKALQGFARSCGVDISQLTQIETDKGAWMVYRTTQPGQSTVNLIPDIVNSALEALPIPKRMRWGNLEYQFVRPVHWAVILFGEAVIETDILGVKSGQHTYGHRFHHPEPMQLFHPDEYIKNLEERGKVLPIFSIRREKIKILVEQAAEELNGQVLIDEGLLEEVTSLVEYPVVIKGEFDPKFLQIPPEALISTMQAHQKYFPVFDDNQALLPWFITISNIDSPHPELIKAGNERVIRPRFSDAMFFWQQDKAIPLANRLERLKNVTFQQKLGSLYEKSCRIMPLTAMIAKELQANELQAKRAAELSKCDLVTDMVGEFPELQGIMGEYYARHEGEPAAVAIALREQYMPRYWGDKLPETALGQALSIADRLDSLIGIFGIDQPPTGDKDPFGLRRAALSVLRIMIECQLPLNLHSLLQQAQTTFTVAINPQASSQVFEFMLERLRGYYQDKGVHWGSIEAVLACQPVSPYDADLRIRGVEAFRQLAAAESLASANKRIHNILKKTEEKFPQTADPSHFTEAAEKALYEQLQAVESAVKPLLAAGNYPEALQQMAGLRETVDNFFDEVRVMAEDSTVRLNRLAFLQSVRAMFLQVADISKLAI